MDERKSDDGTGVDTNDSFGKTEEIGCEELESRAKAIHRQWQSNLDRLRLPLHHYDLSAAGCRILIIPWTAEAEMITVSNGQKYEVPLVRQDESGRTTTVCAIRVRQKAHDTCVTFFGPLPLQVWYNAGSDNVDVLSQSKARLTLEPISCTSLGAAVSGDVHGIVCYPKVSETIVPGAWEVRIQDKPMLRLVLFPRQYRFELLETYIPQVELGKRQRNKQNMPQGPGSSRTALSTLSGPLELLGAQTARISGGGNQEDSYELTALRTIVERSKVKVIEARHSKFHNLIIVKILKFPHEQSARVRGVVWNREFGIGMSLDSDKIARLYGGDARFDCLFEERVEGWDLGASKWRSLEQGENWGYFSGSRTDARRILLDVSEALLYLFEQQIVHNDVKPENIMYSKSRGAVLIDLGMYTRFGSGHFHGGTVWYIAPDFLINTEREAPADMWAFGIVMLYLLGHIRLPGLSERGDPKSVIRDLFQGSKASKVALGQWLTEIQTAVDNLPCDDMLSNITRQMLKVKVSERTTPQVLHEQLSRLKAKNEGL